MAPAVINALSPAAAAAAWSMKEQVGKGRKRWNVLGLLVLVVAVLPSRGAMSVDQDATCSHLDRHQYLAAPGTSAEQQQPAPMVEEEFRGHITVLYNVAPPKPLLTRRIYKERDPIYYHKIQFDEQIKLFHNLFHRFDSNGYGQLVQFILGASPSRHPDETETHYVEFDDFLDNVTSLAASYNISLYPNAITGNGTFAMFGLKEFQVYVIDRCSRIAYIIEPPWSLIQYSYVKAAVLSTIYDRPCGECDVDNFVNSSLPEKGEHRWSSTSATPTKLVKTTAIEESTTTSSVTSTLAQSEEVNATNFMDEEDFSEDTKPYDESTEGEEEMFPIDENMELDPVTSTEETPRISQAINITEVDSSESDYDDPFANLTVTGPELILPLKIVIPAVHIHYDRPKVNNTFKKYEYIVFDSNNPAVHHHPVQPNETTGEDGSQLREISLEGASANSTLRVIGVDWPLQQLRDILNASAILYDDQTTQVFRRLARYNGSAIDELEELSIGSRYAAWKRLQAEQAEAAKTEKRNFIRKHYERLIQWLSWQFDKS